MTRQLCGVCSTAVAVAGGMCRRCYDRTPERRAARREWQRQHVRWRLDGLHRDPWDGWDGAHGVAVRARSGYCAYRRPSNNDPDKLEVRRPGHPLAGKSGWVLEPRMIAYDRWVADNKPQLRCVWCRCPLVWKHRVPARDQSRNARRHGPNVVHVVLIDQLGSWSDPQHLGVACQACASGL